MQKNTDKNMTAILWIILGTLARIIPHPANMTPMTSIALFGGAKLSRKWAFVITLLSLVASDLLLSQLQGYPPFGAWSFFTYSGFAAIIWAGLWLQKSATAGRTLGWLLGSSLFFWTWTNLGVWFTGGMYPLNGSGLMACYVAALPFLRNALLGDLAWGFVFFASFAGARNLAAKRGWQIESA